MLWTSIQKEVGYNPEPKAAHISEKIGRKIYIFGGWNGRAAVNLLEVFDIDKEEWSLLNCSGDIPTPRNNCASSSMNEYIYLHGGHDGDRWLDDFYILDTKKLNWQIINLNNYKPKARACHTLSRMGRKIYMYGGYDGNESFSNMEVFDIETHIWSIVKIHQNSYTPSPRNAHSATIINKKIYIFAGHFQNNHLNDLVIFDPSKNTWTSIQLFGSVPLGLRGHSASFIFNKIYIFGGYNGKTRSNDIYRVSIEDFYFVKIKNNRDTIYPRQRHTANTINCEKIFYFGGFEGNRWLNSVDILSISVLEENLSLQKSKQSLKNNFLNLINKKEYSDLVFVIDNKKIYTNKSILSVRVQYFRNMFSEDMLEKNLNVIEITNFEHKTFLLFLEYIYTSDISCREPYLIIKLYELADSYSYDSLKSYCEELISLMINKENIIEILILGYKCESEVLQNVALDYILKNRKEISANDSINDLVEYPILMLKIIKY